MPELNVLTLNVRGLRVVSKRRAVFRFLHINYPNHIAVLQETHSQPADEPYWKAEWGADILFSHGQSVKECGVAVCMPRALQGHCKVTGNFASEDGRLIIASLEFTHCTINLIAIYAPTQSQNRQQVQFYSHLQERLQGMSEEEKLFLLICGDMNLHLSSHDIQGNRFRLSSAAKVLTALMKDLNLVDIWRQKNPELRRYTWRRFAPQVQQSRIDYIIASEHLISSNIVQTIEIKPSILSDHSLVAAEMSIYTSSRGPGLFRFQNELLQDKTFTEEVRHEIGRALNGEGVYHNVSDWGLKLEVLSSQIRVMSSKKWKENVKRKRDEEKKYVTLLGKCEAEISDQPNDELIERYNELRDIVEQIELEKAKKAMIYSGARWIEEGEKPTRYFLNLYKSRSICTKEKANQRFRRFRP